MLDVGQNQKLNELEHFDIVSIKIKTDPPNHHQATVHFRINEQPV